MKYEDRVNRLESVINSNGIDTVAKEMGLTTAHITRNLLTGKSAINLVKLVSVERKLSNKS
jgi:hypothetical protein